MTKSELLGRMRTNVNNCKLVHVSMFLLADDTAFKRYVFWSQLFFSSQPNLPQQFAHEEIAPLLLDKAFLPIALPELRKAVYRDAVLGSYEVLKEYCKSTDQDHLLKTQPCVTFLRVLRNCVAHKCVFTFKPWEKTFFPVTWSGKTIDPSLEGKTLDEDFMSFEELILLLNDVKRFSEEKLN